MLFNDPMRTSAMFRMKKKAQKQKQAKKII